MDAASMAGAQPQQPQIAPGAAPGGVDPQKVKQALQMVAQQAVNQQGYIDMNKVIELWPQVAQQLGINIPFQTVWQMIMDDPSLVEDIIQKMGLAGIIANGKTISAEELMQQAQGGAGVAGG